MFCKKELKNFTNYAGKHLVTRPATLLKRDSNTSIFLWNLQNFQEHLFWRIAANDCFCSFFLMAPIMESLLNKVASLQACNFIKKRTPTQVFSCGVCKVFKNTYFEEYLRTTAFVVSFSWHLCWSLFLTQLQVFRTVILLKTDFITGVFLWNLQNF